VLLFRTPGASLSLADGGQRAARLLGDTIHSWSLIQPSSPPLGKPPARPAPQALLLSPPPPPPAQPPSPPPSPSPPPPSPAPSPPPSPSPPPPPPNHRPAYPEACKTCATADALTFNSHAVKLFSDSDSGASRGLFVRPRLLVIRTLRISRDVRYRRSRWARWACRTSFSTGSARLTSTA
jgi:hypothetical protein